MAKPRKHYNGYRARWTDEHGRRHSETCPTFAEAMSVQRARESQVDEIKRGIRSPRIADRKFDALCDYWLTKRAPLKRSGKDDESIIRRHLRPFYAGKPLTAIGTATIDEYKATHAALNAKTVANHLTLLGSMLNLAVELGWLARKPRIAKPRVALFSHDFRYLRTASEVDRFLVSARDEADPSVVVLYATAVFTGMRAGELAGLRWDDVDFANRHITVQRSFDGPTKAGDVRYVPILDALLATLRDWRLRNPLPFVFPNNAGVMHAPSARIFQEVFHRVLKRAGFAAGDHRSYIRFHDLRHTFASHWVMNGGDVFKLQKLLGHKSMQMTMRYAHLAPHAYEADYARFGKAQVGAVVVRQLVHR